MVAQPVNAAPFRVLRDAELGTGVVVRSFSSLTGCRVGGWTWIGSFVEVQRGVVVGARCKIQSHALICSGVTLGDDVVVGEGVVFLADRTSSTMVEDGVYLGAGALISPGVRIGARARIEEGAVVHGDVPAGAMVAGAPLRAELTAQARNAAVTATLSEARG